MSSYTLYNEKYEVTVGYDTRLDGYFWLLVHYESDNDDIDELIDTEYEDEQEQTFLFNHRNCTGDPRMTINDIRDQLRNLDLFIPAEMLKQLYKEAKENGFFTKLEPSDFLPKCDQESRPNN